MSKRETIATRLKAALSNNWRLKARAEQLPPKAFGLSANTWLVMSGRGWGKSWTGANVVQEWAQSGMARRIALVAPTAADARDIMIEGPSGILAIAPDNLRPEYEPSKRRLSWPNGVTATLFSADEPERLRGPQHDFAWTEELAAWKYPEAWGHAADGLARVAPRRRPAAVCGDDDRPSPFGSYAICSRAKARMYLSLGARRLTMQRTSHRSF